MTHLRFTQHPGILLTAFVVVVTGLTLGVDFAFAAGGATKDTAPSEPSSSKKKHAKENGADAKDAKDAKDGTKKNVTATSAASPPTTENASTTSKSTDVTVVVDDDIVRAAHAAGQPTSCEACHTEDGWIPARFSHDRTGFPLEGAHTKALCGTCHQRGFDVPTPTTCASCHQDTHRQELGAQCQTCHTPKNWSSMFPTFAHRRTGFPLSGRHAFIPCEECHGEKRDTRFTRAPLDCVDCHAKDAERTMGRFFDHVRNARTANCQGCHDPWAFVPARFAEHERCFTLARGPHRSVNCRECHSPSSPVVARGTCRTETVQCASCHAHNCNEMDDEHRSVRGYQCASLACAQCHGGGQR